ncbi:hypothetical protein [Microvirga yunnanensis]|uniref:hypothetical protein n=1 Tax=Microvirga yunnanensis TaxID=2953740 RepID=UPI0021C97C84|nr:hypothetical protein [Microvirga sp. HBU65207]
MRDADLKFKELAEKRVRRAAKELQLIGNLGNRSNYRYEEEDVRKIFAYLERALREAKRRFEVSSRNRETDEFSL